MLSLQQQTFEVPSTSAATATQATGKAAAHENVLTPGFNTIRNDAKNHARNNFNLSDKPNYDLYRKLTSKSLNDLAKPLDKNLINKLTAKGWKIDIVKPGTDDWRWLTMNGADASFNTGVQKHILLKEGAPKSALLEEFLHGTQNNLGLLEKYGTPQALEVHVKDFMLRHAKLLGLDNPNDIRLLQQLKIEEINRLRNMQK